MKLSLSLLFAFLLQFQTLQAQNTADSVKPLSGWTHAGIGFSGAKFQTADVGLLLGLGATFKTGDNLFSFRFNRNIEFDIFGPQPSGEVWTLEALYGKSYEFSAIYPFIPIIPIGLFFKGDYKYLLNFSAGLSYVGLKERTIVVEKKMFGDEYSTGKSAKFGVPVELEIISMLTKNFGFGAGIYSNINSGRIFVGFRTNAYIGIF